MGTVVFLRYEMAGDRLGTYMQSDVGLSVGPHTMPRARPVGLVVGHEAGRKLGEPE